MSRIVFKNNSLYFLHENKMINLSCCVFLYCLWDWFCGKRRILWKTSMNAKIFLQGVLVYKVKKIRLLKLCKNEYTCKNKLVINPPFFLKRIFKREIYSTRKVLSTPIFYKVLFIYFFTNHFLFLCHYWGHLLEMFCIKILMLEGKWSLCSKNKQAWLHCWFLAEQWGSTGKMSEENRKSKPTLVINGVLLSSNLNEKDEEVVPESTKGGYLNPVIRLAILSSIYLFYWSNTKWTRPDNLPVESNLCLMWVPIKSSNIMNSSESVHHGSTYIFLIYHYIFTTWSFIWPELLT